MQIALAQLNQVLGDLPGNARAILTATAEAERAGARLVVTPELSLCGYPPEDLVLRPAFLDACASELAALAAGVRRTPVIVGFPERSGGRCHNALAVLKAGRVAEVYRKQQLPNYTVFDEERYFDTDDKPCVVPIDGINFGVNICEDTWGEQGPLLAGHGVHGKESNPGVDSCAGSSRAEAPRAARAAGAQVLLVLNASPYHLRKQHSRYDVMRERVVETGMPLVYANMVGGQDELVFDGASFALNRAGQITRQLPIFREALGIVTIENGDLLPGEVVPERAVEADVYDALCLGVRDYVTKNGFKHVVIGLSGGIDSSIVAAVAVDALGAANVTGVTMPSPFSSSGTRNDAVRLAKNLGIDLLRVPITSVLKAYKRVLAGAFKGLKEDVTEENLQARIRGNYLMALSNKFSWLVLNTGNKSEIAVGYTTLYGDMAGGFAVIKDCPKMLVYKLSEHANVRAGREIIPKSVFTRPPSAELRPGQTDQDSLPSYEMLDAILECYVEGDLGVADIVARGFDAATVKRVIAMVDRNEYKRRQGAIGIKITPRAFGKDWRLPIVNKFRE
jgi:NAD+ synthetase